MKKKHQETQWKNRPYCARCKKEYDTPFLWCPECNNLLEIKPLHIDHKPDLKKFWDFTDFFPHFSKKVSLKEGNTSILKIHNIPELRNTLMKLEFRNPTGSFRDRAAALLVSDALSRKSSDIITVSTGSFSISISAYASRAGLKSLNFLPENLELTKIEQMKIYGSEVHFSGKCIKEAMEAAEKFLQTETQRNIYVPLPNQNILTIEGQKTIGLEIALQNPEIENIVVPRGSGTLVYSIYKGLLDARESGWIDQIPHIYSVSLKESADARLAESLEINDPILLSEVSRILQETDGKEIAISGQKMVEQALELAKLEGIFIEPASASVLVGIKQLNEQNSLDLSRTITVLTGSGINAMNLFASQMREVKKALWGVTATSTKKFEILRIIAEGKAHHGYGIWSMLGKKRSIQSIYQHLSQLEKENLIYNSRPSDKRAQYELTEKGLQVFRRMRELMEIKAKK
ncbi:MAG: pyridoxal-phosphate dependent enzyme [Promethearchaeota archaeon]